MSSAMSYPECLNFIHGLMNLMRTMEAALVRVLHIRTTLCGCHQTLLVGAVHPQFLIYTLLACAKALMVRWEWVKCPAQTASNLWHG